MIGWKDEFSIGVDMIDEQHKKLFEIANRVVSLVNDDFSLDKYDKILQVINELKDYTIFHFESEEKYMQQIGYRKFLSHKIEHDDFIEKVNNVDFEHLDENQDEYINEILRFVLDWIVGHILEKDKLIVSG